MKIVVNEKDIQLHGMPQKEFGYCIDTNYILSLLKACFTAW